MKIDKIDKVKTTAIGVITENCRSIGVVIFDAAGGQHKTKYSGEPNGWMVGFDC